MRYVWTTVWMAPPGAELGRALLGRGRPLRVRAPGCPARTGRHRARRPRRPRRFSGLPRQRGARAELHVHELPDGVSARDGALGHCARSAAGAGTAARALSVRLRRSGQRRSSGAQVLCHEPAGRRPRLALRAGGGERACGVVGARRRVRPRRPRLADRSQHGSVPLRPRRTPGAALPRPRYRSRTTGARDRHPRRPRSPQRA